jgi:uncharacterized protein (DUF983 family)
MTISVTRALTRGLFGRCPNCGRGSMFRAFLKVADHCLNCGEELHHHRADDFPAYCVIFLLGHVLIPTVVWVEIAYAPPYWLQMLVWLPATVIAGAGLLQPVKGVIVALQWAVGMHGFAIAKAARQANR